MNELNACPFCKATPQIKIEPLWDGSHGYHNKYDIFVKCTNKKCRVNPQTKPYNTIYGRTESDCISKSIQDWNTREEISA